MIYKKSVAVFKNLPIKFVQFAFFFLCECMDLFLESNITSIGRELDPLSLLLDAKCVSLADRSC